MITLSRFLKDRDVTISEDSAPDGLTGSVIAFEADTMKEIESMAIHIMEADFKHGVWYWANEAGLVVEVLNGTPDGSMIPHRFNEPFDFIEPFITFVDGDSIASSIGGEWTNAKYELSVPAQKDFSLVYFMSDSTPIRKKIGKRFVRRGTGINFPKPKLAMCGYFKR